MGVYERITPLSTYVIYVYVNVFIHFILVGQFNELTFYLFSQDWGKEKVFYDQLEKSCRYAKGKYQKSTPLLIPTLPAGMILW